jgi:Bacterial alpha-L-rhamnosidase 6 hairpin glycosidase domain
LKRRRFLKKGLGFLGSVSALAQTNIALPSEGQNQVMELRPPDRSWLVKLSLARPEILHFGLDSEGTGREGKNLLRGPVELRLGNPLPTEKKIEVKQSGTHSVRYVERFSGAEIEWTVSQRADAMTWLIHGRGNTGDSLAFVFPLDPSVTPTVVLPHASNELGHMAPPWLLVAPDYGHLLIEPTPPQAWRAVMKGRRRSNRRGELQLWLQADLAKAAGRPLSLKFARCEILPPPGLNDMEMWKHIRRPWLNIFQPASAWAGVEESGLLANNVLSNVAGVSYWYYSAPIRMHPILTPGIDLRPLLRRSLDYWLENKVRGEGNVEAFDNYDLYLVTNPNLILAAWDYWKASGDVEWVRKHIERLHFIADFVVRRDQNGDGLTESIQSGNRYSLRDPDRADAWWEMVNFGGTNAWTNSQAYRAYLCMAEMLEAIGEAGGASYYRSRASRLKDAYFKTFYNPKTGWLAGWISQDGEMHDYCHTNVIGRAVAYGLVPEAETRRMMQRVVGKMHSIGFETWDLGVPMNLLPVLRADTIQPRRLLNGQLAPDDWARSDDGTASFGKVAYNGIISPAQTLWYLLGLQSAGLQEEAGRILKSMLATAEAGGFQNGVVDEGYAGAEHRRWDRGTAGYEGYLSDNYSYLVAYLTRQLALRQKFLLPMTANVT